MLYTKLLNYFQMLKSGLFSVCKKIKEKQRFLEYKDSKKQKLSVRTLA
jgi:hypothetical protein